MTLPISPIHTLALRDLLDQHVAAAFNAAHANDLDAIRAALNACWGLRVKALDLINEAEREAREAALARVEQAA